MKLFHYNYDDLKELLNNKENDHSSNIYNSVKEHINECNLCWNLWNRVRWDNAMRSDNFSDLKDFFGDKYIPYFDSSWALANQWYSQNPKTEDEVANFYKSTPYYVYNSFIFNKSGDRISKVSNLIPLIKSLGISSVLDFGCGIGLDGEEMLDMGLEVHFVDYISPSTDFLKWRLKKHGKEERSHFYDVEKIQEIKPEVEMVWSIDVLEHMSNPLDIINVITNKTRVFAYYIDSSELNGGRHPFHRNVDYRLIEEKLTTLGFSKDANSLIQTWTRKKSA